EDLVAQPGQEHLTVGGERRRGERGAFLILPGPRRLSLEQELPGGGSPDKEYPARGARRQQRAVGGESEVTHRTGHAGQRPRRPGDPNIPQAQAPVLVPGRQLLAIGGEGEGAHRSAWAGELARGPAGRQVEQVATTAVETCNPLRIPRGPA